MLNMRLWSPPDGDTARHAVSRCSIVSQSPNSLSTANSAILTFHIQPQPRSWLSHLSERHLMRVGQGKDKANFFIIALTERRWDQPKSNRELLTLSWVRPNHLNSLTHSAAPPNTCWCDFDICSHRGEEGQENNQDGSPPLIPIHIPTAFLTL